MFFPEKLKSIEPHFNVLEIGPGGLPHPRANIFLEKRFDDEIEKAFQRGYAPKLETKKPVVFYEGGVFPFEDKQFDYVICSHVLEHVNDIGLFISELSRISNMGYLEYPLIYYDYIYNFDVHLTFLKKNGSCINWIPKHETELSKFRPVQEFFFETIKKNYHTFINQMKQYFFEGFEWRDDLQTKRVYDINEVCIPMKTLEIPDFNDIIASKKPIVAHSAKQKLKNKLKSIIDKI